MTSHASKTSVYLLKYSFIIYEMQLTTSTRLMLTHPRVGRWHEDDDHHHLTKINHYTVALRLRLRPSLNALVAMLVAMRLERLRPSPNLFFFTPPHSPRPRTPRTANRIRPMSVQWYLLYPVRRRLLTSLSQLLATIPPILAFSTMRQRRKRFDFRHWRISLKLAVP